MILGIIVVIWAVGMICLVLIANQVTLSRAARKVHLTPAEPLAPKLPRDVAVAMFRAAAEGSDPEGLADALLNYTLPHDGEVIATSTALLVPRPECDYCVFPASRRVVMSAGEDRHKSILLCELHFEHYERIHWVSARENV